MKENENNSGIESDSSDDQIKAHAAIGRTQDKPNIDSTSRAYLKNVLMKYLARYLFRQISKKMHHHFQN